MIYQCFIEKILHLVASIVWLHKAAQNMFIEAARMSPKDPDVQNGLGVLFNLSGDVGHCLRKMVLLNLPKSYLDLAERFLVGFQDLSGTPKLPSRQQVEYVLIRTLSTSKLVCEAINYSRESFCYIIQKLKVGHLILDLIMAASIIARLNILLRATLEQLSSMYKQVLFWRYKVKKGEFQWEEEVVVLDHMILMNPDYKEISTTMPLSTRHQDKTLVSL